MKRLVLVALLSLSGCLHTQQPLPVGQPGPVECFAAQETERAWLKYVAPAVEKGLAAQVAYSCSPTAPAQPPPPAFAPPPLEPTSSALAGGAR